MQSHRPDSALYDSVFRPYTVEVLSQLGTVTGQMYIDNFELGTMSAQVAVGTIETQTKNFQQFYVIDGVMGFACSSSYGLPIPIVRSLFLVAVNSDFLVR